MSGTLAVWCGCLVVWTGASAAGEHSSYFMPSSPPLPEPCDPLPRPLLPAGGTCDAACTEAKQKLWHAAVVGLWIRGLARAHHVASADVHGWLQKMQDFLPGESGRGGVVQAAVLFPLVALNSCARWLR